MEAPFGSGDGPRFIDKVLPRYPRLARDLGIEGNVLLSLTIDERGRLMELQVIKKAGSGFDEEAVRAVKESTFSPAKRDGKPVACRASLLVRFVLRSTGND
jgi:protein TonB